MSTIIEEAAKSVNISEENIKRLVFRMSEKGMDDQDSLESDDFKDMEEEEFQDFTKGILDKGKSNEFLDKLKEASSGNWQKQPVKSGPGRLRRTLIEKKRNSGLLKQVKSAPPRGPFLSAGNTLLSNGRSPNEMTFAEIMEMIQRDGVRSPSTSDLRAIQSHVEYLYKKVPPSIGKNNLIQFNSIVSPNFQIASGGGGKRKSKKRKSKRKQGKKSRKRSKTRRRR